MNTKIVLLIVAFVGVVAGVALYSYSSSQKVVEAKTYHVGILLGLQYFARSVDGFKDELTSLGYVEGKNIVYDVQTPPSIVGNEAILQKFVDDKVDLIVALPTEPSIEAKKVAKDTGVPVIGINGVFEGTGFADSFQLPGGNVTGVRYPAPEVSARRFDVLHELVPTAKKMFVPYLKDYPSVPTGLNAILPLAQVAGVTIVSKGFKTPDELQAYLDSAALDDIDAILTIPEPIAGTPASIGALLAYGKQHSIPVGGIDMTPGADGALFEVAHDPYQAGKLAAPMADKIFKGVPAGTIPVSTPEPKFTINYSVAQRLGIEISENYLAKADEIIR